jgi:hypothetical protein
MTDTNNMTAESTAGNTSDSANGNGNIGNNSNDFINSLSEDLRTDSSLKDFRDVNGLAKSYAELNKMLGSRVALPGENATEEELNRFYSKLGRPESPDKYDINRENETELFKSFRETAFKSGMTDKQVKEVYNLFDQYAKTKTKELEAENKKLEEDFTKEFGKDGENIKKNVNGLLAKNLKAEDIEVLDNLEPRAQLILIRALNGVANSMPKEGMLRGGEGATTKTMEELIKDKLKITQNNMNYANNPEYTNIMRQINDLTKQKIREEYK